MRTVLLLMLFGGFCLGDVPKRITSYKGAETVMNYKNLPAHEAVEISFIVHFIGPWDGSGFERWSPDRFLCGVTGGPRLIDSTFNNCHLIWRDNCWQSFPDPYHLEQADASPFGSRLHHGATGAEAVATFGIGWSGTESVDSTYRFRFVVSNSSDSIELKFWTEWKEQQSNPTTYWIDDLEVKPIEALPELSQIQQEDAWLSLFADDGLAAHKSWAEVFLARPELLVTHAKQLVEGSEQRLDFLAKEFHPGPLPIESLSRKVPKPKTKDAHQAYRQTLLLRELALGEAWFSKNQDWWDKSEHRIKIGALRQLRCSDQYIQSNPPLHIAKMRIASYLRMIGSKEASELAERLDPPEKEAK